MLEHKKRYGTKQNDNFYCLCLHFIVLSHCLICVPREAFFNHLTGELQEAHSIFEGMRVDQGSRVENCRVYDFSRAWLTSVLAERCYAGQGPVC